MAMRWSTSSGPPGTGKSHLATALGVEAVKACRGVYISSLADVVSALAKAEREGRAPRADLIPSFVGPRS